MMIMIMGSFDVEAGGITACLMDLAKIWQWERERERERECVCVWERERERETEYESTLRLCNVPSALLYEEEEK